MKELKTVRDVLHALLYGYEVEVFRSEPLNTWETVDNMCFDTQYLDDEVTSGKYRIAPTKPSIDWTQVCDKYNYLARDKDGLASLYQNKPSLHLKWWYGSTGEGDSALTHKSYKSGTCCWKDSLVERPK